MDRFSDGLLWIDADETRFWVIAWAAFSLVVATALFAPEESSAPGQATRFWRRTWFFILCIFLTLFAFRWPTWFVPTSLNPDEAQIIAGAITLQHFPVYWKYVDGTTHGPVCEYLLLIASWFGAPLNYLTARVMAAVLQAGSLIGVWGVLRCFTSEKIARVAVLPGLAFWAFVSWQDFVHYSTELPGIFLLSMAAWCIARALSSPGPGLRTPLLLWLAGVALGLVPLAKLQSTPQALALAGGTLPLLWLTRGGIRSIFVRRLCWFTLGGLTFPLILFIFLLIYGLRSQFWFSYIESSFGYTGMGQHPFMEMPGWFFYFVATSSAFAWFFFGSVGFGLLYTASPLKSPAPLRIGTVVAWILLGVSYFCVIRPCREVAHYLHLMVVPASTLAGFVLAKAVAERDNDSIGRLARWKPVLFFGILTLVPQVYDRLSTRNYFLGHLHESKGHSLSETAEFIRARAEPGDTLAMWGWEPGLYVETNLAQGTREAHSAYQITNWPLQAFYVARYVQDLNRRQPAWFVDAVGTGSFIYGSRDKFAHENTPALKAAVESQYELLAEFDFMRIYHLKKSAKD